jgi:hypothetical protein
MPICRWMADGAGPPSARELRMRFYPAETGGRWSRVLLNKIAIENVAMVPKQIHQGNSITGSQPGCM